MNAADGAIQLKVAEAFQDDVNKGIVRIDSGYMQKAGIRPGDIVEIVGTRKSVAIVDRAYPSDIGQDIIRMDGLIRRNAGTSIGELVSVQKAEITQAKKVTIAPAKKGLVVRAAPEIFKHGLLGRAVVKGDIVSLGGSRRRRSTLSSSPFEEIFRMLDEDMTGFGFGDLKFIIADTNPKQPVIITSETEIVFNPEAVEVSDEEKSFDISYEDVGGLSEPIRKIREMVELPLKHPEIFEALGIEPPKGILLYGPPGTGKTLLAKAVANETSSHFIVINGPEVMCVKGDTQIFTNPSGYVEAQELFKEAKGAPVEQGPIEVIELDEPIKTYAYSGSIEPAKITHVARLTAPAFTVRLSDGNEVVGSHNQPFLTYAAGELVWKRLEELTQGEYVARLNEIDLPEASEPIVLQGDFAELNGKRAFKGRNESRSTWVTVPTHTSESLLEWVGLVLAEGYVGDDSIIFANNDPALRERYTTLLSELFDTSAKTYEDGRVVVYSKVLVELAKFFGMAPGKKVPQVPPMLYRLPKSEVAAFVKGYFDGDGTVAITSDYPTPIIYSASKAFLKQFQGLLQLKLGIPSKLAEHKTPLSFMHKLTVRGHEGRQRFAQIIVPVSDMKRERLAQLPTTGKEWEHIPSPKLLLAHLRANVAYEHYRKNDFYVYEKGEFTRHAMRKLYAIAHEHSTVPSIVEKEYATLMRRDIAFERIESITSEGEQELYDFTVDKDSFTAEPYLLLHNSKYYGQSLPYEEPVLVLKDGRYERIPIGRIVEENMEGLETIAFDNDGNVSVQPITGLIKHERKNPLVRITTRSGRSISVTDDHSLFTLTPEGISDVKTSDLEAGSFIATPAQLPFARDPIRSLDLLADGLRVRGASRFIRNARSVLGQKRTAQLLGVTQRYLYDVIGQDISVPVEGLTALADATGLELDLHTLQVTMRGRSLPAKMPITSELAEFFGLWIAEGSYMKSGVRLSIHRDEEPYVADLCLRLFGQNTIYHKPGSHSSDIIISSAVLRHVMEHVLGFKSGARNKRIPSWVFSLSREHLSAFLRGYVSGDGSVNSKTPAPTVELDTESPGLADDLVHLLLFFGIVPKTYGRPNRPQKRICFSDVLNLERFLEIGFIDEERNRMIATYLVNTSGKSRRDRIPMTALPDSIRSSLSAWSAQKSIGTEALKARFADAVPAFSGIDWDEVTRIEPVDDAPTYVYDISVNPSENFVAGTGGVFAHNSEANLRKKFEEAEQNAPAIIFIDEIDAIASKREEAQGEVEKRVVAQLLSIMDGLKSRGKVVVIAATNMQNQLDPALRRPGRFDREIEIGPPSKQGRLDVLKIHTRNMPGQGRIHPDILQSELPIYVEERVKEIEAQRKKILAQAASQRDARDAVVAEIKELESKTRSSEGGILAEIRDRILGRKQELEKLKQQVETIDKEAAALETRAKDLVSALESLRNNQEELRSIISELQRFFDVTESYDPDDPRRHLAEYGFDENGSIMRITRLLDADRLDGLEAEVRAEGWKRDLEQIASVTHGFVGADLAALSKEAALIVIRRELPNLSLHEEEPIPREQLDRLKIRYRDFLDALKIVRPSAMREVMITVPTTKWSDVAALDDARQSLTEAVEWPLKYPMAFESLGVEPPKGILLYGPSGTGKTLLAKAVANEAEANFISVKGPELLSKWVGESEKAVRQIFDKARQNAPTIIFFDEFDALAPRRGAGSDSHVTERVVNQLLTELDGLEKMTNVVIIGASNRPDIIDPSLLRPGRFDRLIHIKVPDERGRKAILDVHTKRTPLALEGLDRDAFLERIAQHTDGYTGADLESLVREAAITALKRKEDSLREDQPPKIEVTMEDFEKALETVKPSVTKETLEQYAQIEKTIRESPDVRGTQASYFG
jgi:SpoVK/Ycf46/Vps4 family AAA+-type ATPase/intein/homing endonuclease